MSPWPICTRIREQPREVLDEVTCAVPAPRVAALIERLHAARRADLAVAAYAAEDARRFARRQ